MLLCLRGAIYIVRIPVRLVRFLSLRRLGCHRRCALASELVFPFVVLFHLVKDDLVLVVANLAVLQRISRHVAM